MIKYLYDSFAKKWYRGGSIFFYSDPHFGDEEMIRIRGISDEEQVKRINSVVGKCDTIIFLGDIGHVEYIKKIRGYKVLVMGNHEKGATNYREYFEEVYEGVLTISNKILLSHEPVHFEYAINIHGHTHSSEKRSASGLNMSAEAINYTPERLSKIIESGIFKNVPDIHRTTIEIAKEKKEK